MMIRMSLRNLFWPLAAGLTLALLQGCATGPDANPADPLEPFNRGVSRFNDGLDKAIVKPVAIAYRDATPAPVRTGVNNFFGNLADVWSLVNNVLQVKVVEAADSLFRVGVNTTIGLGGLIDVATEMKIEKHPEDFGQTLGFWGVKAGPYVVLPLLGPSTMRDSFAKLVDIKGDVVTNIDRIPVRNSLAILRGVDARASFLDAGELLESAALDKYTFTRDVFLQRRRSLIRPTSIEKEERYDLPEPTAPGKAPAAAEPPTSK